jgi:hypothetical protein
VERNFWVVAWSLAAWAAGAVALGASCTPQTECDYIDRSVADPLHPTEDDVAYCWQGYDPYGLYTLRFERSSPDSGLANPVYIIQPPSSIEPAGSELVTSWSVVPDVQTSAGPISVLDSPGLGGAIDIQVNQTSMLLGAATGSGAALRRAVCKGFGFETEAKACRGSPSRP